MSNTFGTRFRLTTYGESHGPAVGGIIDGCPANVRIDMDAIRADLDRRRDGAPRQEEDAIEWLSGLKNDITLGTPIAFCIRNKYARPGDYDLLAFHPSSARFAAVAVIEGAADIERFGIVDYENPDKTRAELPPTGNDSLDRWNFSC